jgi:hypothetical protein
MSMQQIIEMLAKAEDDRKADKEVSREANQYLLTRMAADKEESREANQELMTRMEAKVDDNQKKAEADKEDLLTKMKEDRKADREDLLARMDAMFETYKKRMMATKKIEKNPGMMQSVEEHQDVSNEDVTVMPVRKPRKRCRVRKSTAGRRGEPKELNRENHGSRKMLAAACRKVSRHAAVIWRKRKLFQRTGTQEICGWCKELTIAGIRTTHCAQVVRRKGRSHEGMSVEQG